MPLKLGAIPTLDDGTYIGVWAKTEIYASPEAIAKVLGDIPNYLNVYQDLEKVSVVQTDPTDTVIDWMFSGPLGTKTKYQTVQKLSNFTPKRSALIYGLKKSDKVTASDGIIFIQEESGTSYYLSIDFFNADWGGLAKLFTGTIWKETCVSTAKTTFIIKYLAENSKEEAPVKQVKLNRANGYDSEMVSQICSEMENRKKQKEFEKQILEILD
jgi:hypothetical protein